MAKSHGWLVPVAVGVAIGWLLSGTIGKVVGPIVGRFGVHPFGYDE